MYENGETRRPVFHLFLCKRLSMLEGMVGHKNSSAAGGSRGKNELQLNVATRKENKVNEKRLC